MHMQHAGQIRPQLCKGAAVLTEKLDPTDRLSHTNCDHRGSQSFHHGASRLLSAGEWGVDNKLCYASDQLTRWCEWMQAASSGSAL